MAIVVETEVIPASQAQHDLVDERMEAVMQEMGGPPGGLMVHFTRPHGDGFLMVDVWRSESEMRSFHDASVIPMLTAVGLDRREETVWPVWTFARP